MDILVLTGFIGAIFSILAFFMTDKFKSKTLTKIVFVILLIGLCCVIVNQNSKLNRVNNVSKSAMNLIRSKSTTLYNSKSFVQAGLTFLESNMDLYPDSYKRAVSLYESYKEKADPYTSETSDLASEIEGIINGIGVLNSEK